VKAYGQVTQSVVWDFESDLERREQIRFGVRALVKFEWIDGQGTRHQEQGFTRDISSRGMFIFSDSLPPTKADLQAEVFFGGIAGAGANLELRVNALVLRVESVLESGSYNGFAVLNRSYSIANQGSIPEREEDPRNAPN
jgi:hypothetical protein